MDEHSSLLSLMIVVSIAFLIPVLLTRLNLRWIPVVVAEIVAGLIIGKSGFNLISEDPWLELLSLFGFIFLMFLSGLEIDFHALNRRKRTSRNEIQPFQAATLIVVFIFIISFGISMLLDRANLVTEPFLMTLIIATISLGVVVPVLKEKRMIETNLGQTILLIAVISDVATMILLAIYMSASSQNMGNMVLLMLFFVAVFATYMFIRNFLSGTVFKALQAGTVQIGTRAVFALILLFVVLSETLQVEMILGAFMAGVIVSLFAPNKNFTHQLDSFGYGFLIPIFFVMVGVNLDLWALFTNMKIMILILVLLAAIFISKMVPALVLRKWYSWRHSIGAGLLLSSTLSLVIAAATIAYEIGIIDQTMQSALILVAVLSCVLSPIFFNRVFPETEQKKMVIAILGANYITIPVLKDLTKEGHIAYLYSAHPPKEESETHRQNGFSLVEVPGMDIESLTDYGVFDADVIVLGTMDDDVNIELAEHARAVGIERVIVRVEAPEKYERLQQQSDFTVFSTLYASRTLLKALIEHPSAVQLITQHDDSIQEIIVNNGQYHNVLLYQLPFLGDTLILRIFRGDSFIIPRGTTEIQLGDRLLVSGNAEQIALLKEHLE